MAMGLSFYKAKQMVSKHHQKSQICLCCNGTMNRATRGVSYFCNKPQCRTAQRRLKHLVYDKGFDRNTALQTVLDELKLKTK